MTNNLFENNTEINKTNILPLRWFANMCGDIAGWAILKISDYDELENFGWKYKFHSFIWKIAWPIYYKFGTFYEFNFDLSGDGWNDYDDNGHSYWYYSEWQEDPETGDAWRLIKKENNSGNM
jgi:hypothetical protein